MSIKLDQKRQSILNADGHILVLGGPGAGKTTIALLKAKALFPTLFSEQKLLFLSFSRAAVRQVLKGCQELLSTEERHAIEVKTYHTFCMELLHSHGKLLNGDAVSIIFPTQERLAKSQFEGDWEVERKRLADEEATYCFDLFATGVAELLERCAALCQLLASCFPMVIVDEFQDTDDQQWRIVKALASVTRVFCLADKDQRIFDYRNDIDPKRIDYFREEVNPQVFDLGGENYRSPRGGILSFADAVLNNVTLPSVDDVKEIRCWPNMFEAMVHAGVIWTFSLLRKKDIKDPCVAVLARSNPLVAKVSGILSVENEYKSSTLRPVDHSVVWDAELSAAAGTVVASILEWSNISADTPVANTLEAVAHYYELKNATSPSNVATNNIRKFRNAAAKIRTDATPRINAAKEMIAAYESGLELVGDPVGDWRMARKLLDDISHLRELYREARMVRLFRATDAIGSGLADLWLQSGHYGGASVLVSNTLEYERLVSADQEPRGCVLMSMHKSKGKEFDGVVIVEEKFSGVLFDKRREQPPFERTRRLLRVAITRARTHVTIIRPQGALPLAQ